MCSARLTRPWCEWGECVTRGRCAVCGRSERWRQRRRRPRGSLHPRRPWRGRREATELVIVVDGEAASAEGGRCVGACGCHWHRGCSEWWRACGDDGIGRGDGAVHEGEGVGRRGRIVVAATTGAADAAVAVVPLAAAAAAQAPTGSRLLLRLERQARRGDWSGRCVDAERHIPPSDTFQRERRRVLPHGLLLLWRLRDRR